jgi:co-chaperonin GroES (HSP10)
MIPFIPIDSYILLEPLYKNETLKSGLVVPISAQEFKTQCIGKVLKIGPKVETKLKLGEKIIYNPYEAEYLKINEGTFILLRLEDVFALYSEDSSTLINKNLTTGGGV